MGYKKIKLKYKLSLSQPISQGFRSLSNVANSAKAILLSACASSERMARQSGIAFSDGLPNYVRAELDALYPIKSHLSSAKWKELVDAFLGLRNFVAHSGIGYPIYLDLDLAETLSEIVSPEYPIATDKGELTMYGTAYVIGFFCAKDAMSSFAAGFFHRDIFRDVPPPKLAEVMVRFLKSFKKYCGTESTKSTRNEVSLNDILRRRLGEVFLRMESIGKSTKRPSTKHFSHAAKHRFGFRKDDPLVEKLILLRNSWFHGCKIGEPLHGDANEIFDIPYVTGVLSEFRDKASSKKRFGSTLKSIEALGESLLEFRLLRLLELSYKILDSRCSSQEKLDERIDNLTNAYHAVCTLNLEYYACASSLISSEDISWSIAGAKFSGSDSKRRTTIAFELKIVLLCSDVGFDIGPFHTDRTFVPICLANIYDAYELPIDGVRLSEMALSKVRTICSRVGVYQVRESALVAGPKGNLPFDELIMSSMERIEQAIRNRPIA